MAPASRECRAAQKNTCSALVQQVLLVRLCNSCHAATSCTVAPGGSLFSDAGSCWPQLHSDNSVLWPGCQSVSNESAAHKSMSFFCMICVILCCWLKLSEEKIKDVGDFSFILLRWTK